MARFELKSLAAGVAIDGEGRGSRVVFSTTVPLYAAATGAELETVRLTDGRGRAPGWVDPDADPGAYNISYDGGPPLVFSIGEATLAARTSVLENDSVEHAADISVIKEADLNVEWSEYGMSSAKTAAQNKAAFDLALAALPSTGGVLLLPSTYNIDPFSVSKKTGVKMRGLGGLTGGAASRTGLVFAAGGVGALVDATSSLDFWMEDLYLQYTNAAFTGTVVDYRHAAVGGYDSAHSGMNRVQISGVGVRGATGIRLNRAIIMQFTGIKVAGCQAAIVGLEGATSGTNYANGIIIDGTSTFISNVLPPIYNPGSGWVINNPIFEGLALADGSPGGAGAIHADHPVYGLAINGGWCGDAAGAVGTWFNLHGYGINMLGTYVGGGAVGARIGENGIARGVTIAAVFDQNTYGISVDPGASPHATKHARLNFDGSEFTTQIAAQRILWGAYSNAAPVAASGLRHVGEVEWNRGPASGEAIGWVCVAGGTPGTWKSMGTIAA